MQISETNLKELQYQLNKALHYKVLKKRNSFFLIDFTISISYGINKLKTDSSYLHSLPNYKNILNSFFDEYGFTFPSNYDADNNATSYTDIEGEGYSEFKDVSPQHKMVYGSYDSGIKKVEKQGDLSVWNNFVKDKYGGMIKGSYTFFQKFFTDTNDTSKTIEIGFYLLTKLKLEYLDQKNITGVLYPFLTKYGINSIIFENTISINYINSDLRNTSLKSSLAAVMSRNMSHNIGSHVLNKLSSASAIQDFFRLTKNNTYVKALKSGEFQKLKVNDESTTLYINISGDDSKKTDECFEDVDFAKKVITKEEQSNYDFVTFYAKEVKAKVKNGNEQIVGYDITPIYKLSPYFVDVNNNTTKEELARVFNDYLKKRMDFVADVATSNKALLNSNKYLFADIFRGFERNLLLLQNISGKEDKFSYQFQFQYCDGSLDNEGNIKVYKYGKDGFVDPIVAVPNDVLGSQAFYIILENIIRNTAKHSGSGNVTFTIKVEDLQEDDFYRVTVFDNVSFSGDNNEEKAEKLKKLVVDRNISIAQEVLDENNEIRTAGWGTIEIKLAACYLSGLDMLEMDNKMYWPIGYPRFEEKKVEIELKDDNKLNEVKKECGEKWESIEKYAEEKATEAYIEFLTSKKAAEFTILKEGLKTASQVIDCPKELTRKIDKETRYPIVQAVDGSVDETSGFGYSFLMKKPKKLLIIDEAGTIKIETKDKDGNKISHTENLTALKRLGIDIVKEPSKDSIYNHQFMIIVGDGQIKEITEDENGNKIIPYYGDWFNLPQERLLSLDGKKYKNFIYDLKSDFFQIINESFEDNTLISCLKFVLGESVKRKYQVLDRFLELMNNAFVNKQNELNSVTLFPDTTRPFQYSYPENKGNNSALFRHHGLQEKVFYDKNTKYAEIYGSVTPLGLLAESIENQIKGKPNFKSSLKKKYQNFYEISANSSVIVIDERIQSSLAEIGCKTESIKIKVGNDEISEDGYQISNRDIFLKTKIYVPDEDVDSVDLNCSDLKTQKKSLKKYIEEISDKVKADYLIIHFGIIEGLRETSKKDSVISILEDIKDWIKSDKCKIVITSGRGYTPDIKSLNQYFVAYSTISNLLLDPNGRSKGHLMQCLKQLRKLKN